MGNNTSLYDRYDGINDFASLGSQCTFCNILRNEGERKFLYEDDYCVIFRDIKNKATAHYQCIPKRHIKNYSRLVLIEEVDEDGNVIKESDDLKLLKHMNTTGK